MAEQNVPLKYTVIAFFTKLPDLPKGAISAGHGILHRDWPDTPWDGAQKASGGANYISSFGQISLVVDGANTAIDGILVREFETAADASDWIDSRQGARMLQGAARTLISCNTRAWEPPPKA